MIQTTRWSPDTCACVIEFTWDDSESESSRVHNYKSIKLCAIHSGLGYTGQSAYNQVVSENTRKNLVLKEVKDYLAIGNGETENRNLLESYQWNFDGNRLLRIQFSGAVALTAPQKAALQSLCNTKFGSGKVEVI